MSKEELAARIEKILTQASIKVNKKLVRAIEKALRRAESGATLEEVLETAKVEKEIRREILKAQGEADAALSSGFDKAASNDNDKAALAGLGIALFKDKVTPGNPAFDKQTYLYAEAAHKAARESMMKAMSEPGIYTVGPALKRFESPSKFYNRVVTEAILNVNAGRTSYEAAVKSAVRDLTRSGLRCVTYQSGATSRIDTAVSRAVLTELSHLQGDIAMENAQEVGTEYFEVDWHEGARPDHQEWQGQVYTMDELETVCGLGEVDGLKGVNCYHQFFPFIPGVSERNWSDDWLAKMNAKENTPASYGGRSYTTYEARQKQRDMEHAMRIERERIDLGYGDREKYTAQRRNYEKFSDAMGEHTHYDRVYRDGLGKM